MSQIIIMIYLQSVGPTKISLHCLHV